MSIRILVNCEGVIQPGDTLCLSGEDASLGAWDASKAVRFQPCPEDAVWSCELPAVPAGGEFKFVVLSAGGGYGKPKEVWEPLERARSWPTAGLGAGALLQTKFGEMKMTISASTAQLEAQARITRDIDAPERRASALQADLDRKGDNAYYHAHNRSFVVPENAKVITGEGLVNGGPPVLLESGGSTVTEEERTQWLKDYSWSDSGKKVKVYVPVAEGMLPEEGAQSMVEATYNATNIDLLILGRPKQRLKIEKLNADVVPESCNTRVEAKKNRIVLELVKKKETTWYNLTKTK